MPTPHPEAIEPAPKPEAPWLPGFHPFVSLTTSMWWFVRLRTRAGAAIHRSVIEGGQGKRWFMTQCGQWLIAGKVDVLAVTDRTPKPPSNACRRCWPS